MPSIDDIILRYNTLIEPTQEEIEEVAKYIPREFIPVPMTINAWFTTLAWANKEQRERINAVAERVKGTRPELKEPALTPLTQWMADKQRAETAQTFQNKAILGSGILEDNFHRMIKKADTF